MTPRYEMPKTTLEGYRFHAPFKTFSPASYLRRNAVVCQKSSMDKVPFEEAIAAFDTTQWDFETADNRPGLKATMRALGDHARQKPNGMLISFDASASVIQMLSLLSGCHTSFDLCGGRQSECVDAYTEISSHMPAEVARDIPRKGLKSAVMKGTYGSTAIPERIFGKTDVKHFYTTMESAAPGAWGLKSRLERVWGLLKHHTYSWTLPDNYHARMTTTQYVPTPFQFMDSTYFHEKAEPAIDKSSRALSPNLVHSIDALAMREMLRRCMHSGDTRARIEHAMKASRIQTTGNEPRQADLDGMVPVLWDHYLRTGFLSVRILDHINERTIQLVDSNVILELLDSLPPKPFEIVGVHDCFRVHANNINYVRWQYNVILAQLSESHLIQALLSEILPTFTYNKVGAISRDHILGCNYTLT